MCFLVPIFLKQHFVYTFQHSKHMYLIFWTNYLNVEFIIYFSDIENHVISHITKFELKIQLVRRGEKRQIWSLNFVQGLDGLGGLVIIVKLTFSLIIQYKP